MSQTDTDIGATLRYSRTQEELEQAFRLVQHPTNWKMECIGEVVADQLPLVIQAISYFTGSMSHVTPTRDGTYIVKAPGYYATIGS